MARLWIGALALACTASWAAEIPPRCDLAQEQRKADESTRGVTIRDILHLRDITDVTLSPDGRHALFRVHAADEVANGHCARWYLVSTAGRATPRDLGSAGDLPFDRVGQPTSGRPVWTSDGVSFIYLEGGKRVVRKFIEGNKQLTLVDADASNFALSHDGKRIVVQLEPAKGEVDAEKERLARNGIVYDEVEFVPFVGLPETRAGLKGPVVSVALDGSDRRDASVEERHALDNRGNPYSRVAQRIMRSKWNSTRTRLAAMVDVSKPGEAPFHVLAIATGSDFSDLKPVTEGIRVLADFWWARNDTEIVFTHQPPGRSVYKRLNPQSGQVQTIRDAASDGYLTNCDIDRAGTLLACLNYSALVAPEVATLRLSDGALTILTSVNPEYAALRKGVVKRYEWTNSHGDTTWGTLLLPPGYEPGRKYPLVVTAYRGGGFLRGNVGDEYPIQPMADHGIAVLSWGQTRPYSPVGDTWQDLSVTLREYTSPLDSIQEIVRTLAREGMVDMEKLGIAGMSYGSQVTNYAISRSQMFAAAAVGNPGGMDRSNYFLGGKGIQRSFEKKGLGLPTGGTAPEWQRLSTAMNADRIRAPLLMQYSASEYLVGIEQYVTMKMLGKAVDLIIYPREAHLKKEPVHKLLVYERNLDWFRFWLKGETDPDPAKASQYKRWELMRGR